MVILKWIEAISEDLAVVDRTLFWLRACGCGVVDTQCLFTRKVPPAGLTSKPNHTAYCHKKKRAVHSC